MSKTIEEILAPKPEPRPRIYAYSIADKAHTDLEWQSRSFFSCPRLSMKLSRPVFALCMIAVFIAVHAFFFLQGVRFDVSTLPWFWQYLDIDLLKNHLLESLYYLHSQPPFFNLFLGIVIKLFPAQYPLMFHCVYLCLGVALYLSLFELQTMLGVARLPAFLISTFYIMEPSFVLYKHWLFYTFPVTALLTFAIVFLAKYALSLKSRFLWGFFLTLFLVCGIRSMFHLAYLSVVALGAILVFPRDRRKVITASLVTVIMLIAVYGKNEYAFGKFGTSSWLGMHLWDIVSTHLPEETKTHLVAQGALSNSYDENVFPN